MIALTLGLLTYSSACECPGYRLAEMDSISYKNNEIVLIGKITSIDQDCYEIEVKQLIKGNITSKKIVGIYSLRKGLMSSCSFYPQFNTDYLLYLNPTQTGKDLYYYASQCEGSRALDQRQKPLTIYESDKQLNDWTGEWIEQMKKE